MKIRDHSDLRSENSTQVSLSPTLVQRAAKTIAGDLGPLPAIKKTKVDSSCS